MIIEKTKEYRAIAPVRGKERFRFNWARVAVVLANFALWGVIFALGYVLRGGR